MQNTQSANLLLAFIIIVGFFSCKSKLEKIDINNVEAHRNYQDSILRKSNTAELQYLDNRQLITDYLSLKGEGLNNSVNYNYYLARLYNYITELPNGFWQDSITKKMKNIIVYNNVYDSTYYFVNKILTLDPNNLRAMNLLCITMLGEEARYSYDNSFPTSMLRDTKSWNDRFNYILNNAIRFKDYDSSSEKSLARNIAEIAMYYVGKEITYTGSIGREKTYTGSYDFLESNDTKTKQLYIYGDLYDFLKGKKYVFFKFNEKYINDSIYPNVLLARNDIDKRNKIAAEKERIANEAKNRLDKISHFRNDYKNYMFQIKELGMKQGIVLNNDGTFVNGEYDYNSNNQYVFISIFNKGTWDVIDDNTIILHNFFGTESKMDYKFVLERDHFFGSDILILHGLYTNGNLGNNAMIYQRYIN